MAFKKTRVANYANRYVEIGAFHFYPSDDVALLAERLKNIIGKLERDAYQNGIEAAEEKIRRAINA